MIIDNGLIKLEVFERYGRFAAEFAGNEWRESDGAYIEVENAGCVSRVKLTGARRVLAVPFQNGVGRGARIAFEDFIGYPGVRTEVAVWLEEASPRLRFDVENVDAGGRRFVSIQWPAPFEYIGTPRDGYALVPMMQGLLIPRDFGKPVEIVMPPSSSPVLFNERAAYMAWLAQARGRKGYLILPDNADDCGYTLNHHPGEGTELGLVWQASMGGFSYRRGAAYHFFEDCDYSGICKIYRNYAREKGYLVTLREKLERTPALRKLIGSPVIPTEIMMEWNRASGAFGDDRKDYLYTFKERGAQILRLKEMGLKKAYLHLDGWGKAGYDSKHPDVWPPCEAAGGIEGMRAFGKLLKDNDVLFAIHDQYRDYYANAETFDVANARKLRGGEAEFECSWCGGEQTHLCNTLAPDYVRRNFERFRRADIALDGAYLDVFSIIALDECYDAKHPMTRAMSREARGRCFDYVRSLGMIISSEEPVEWSVPHLDLVHHAPFPTRVLGAIDECRAIPVPLFELVYHDCIVTPWCTSVGGWGVPKGRDGSLYAMLFGDTAYLGIDADMSELKRIEAICQNHARLATVELISHEYLDTAYNAQRAVFADGTVITIDMDARSYSIQ